MMQGELFVFESADSVRTSENETEAALFPVEYLNSLTASEIGRASVGKECTG